MLTPLKAFSALKIAVNQAPEIINQYHETLYYLARDEASGISSSEVEIKINRLNSALTAIKEIIEIINQSSHKKIDVDAPEYATLMQYFRSFYEDSLMVSDLINQKTKSNNTHPMCSDELFNDIRQALAPKTKKSLQDLPKEVLGVENLNKIGEKVGIGSYLTEHEQMALSETSQRSHSFFEKERDMRVKKEISRLLSNGLTGKLDKVEKKLRKSPEMMFVRSNVKKSLGREFLNTNLVEIMRWLWDIESLKMMLNCINEHPTLDDTTKNKMKGQLKALCEPTDLTIYYYLTGRERSSHWPLTSLIEKMESSKNNMTVGERFALDEEMPLNLRAALYNKQTTFTDYNFPKLKELYKLRTLQFEEFIQLLDSLEPDKDCKIK